MNQLYYATGTAASFHSTSCATAPPPNHDGESAWSLARHRSTCVRIFQQESITHRLRGDGGWGFQPHMVYCHVSEDFISTADLYLPVYRVQKDKWMRRLQKVNRKPHTQEPLPRRFILRDTRQHISS